VSNGHADTPEFITIIFNFETHFYNYSKHHRKIMSRFNWKHGQQMANFHDFFDDQDFFVGPRWNISTNETVIKFLKF
jgi:hypothetical protein